MFLEQDAHAVELLEAQNVSRLDVMEYVAHGVSKVGPDDFSKEIEPAGGLEDGEGRPRKDPLDAFCLELVARAAEGKLDALVGRDAELERLVHVLCRRRQNNPVPVGR